MGLDPERIRGAVTVYRHRRSGLFQVQPMCRRGKLGLADAGQPVLAQPGDDEALVVAVLRALESFQTNTFGPEAVRFSRKEQAKFVREHDSVMVVRSDDGLKVTAWERTRGGYASNDRTTIQLRDPFTAASLACAVKQAFHALA